MDFLTNDLAKLVLNSYSDKSQSQKFNYNKNAADNQETGTCDLSRKHKILPQKFNLLSL